MLQLMSERADNEEFGQWLRAPLLHACETANADLVDKLLEAGADGTNRGVDENDLPLLHAGARGGSERVLVALLNAGCKPDVDFRPPGGGLTALQVVVRNGKKEAARVLMTACAGTTATLNIAIQEGHEPIALDLLLAGADPHAGASLLYASRRGYAQVVSALLLRGADLHATFGNGDTVLHAAAFRGRVSTVKALLAGGAALGAFNGNGETPLHYAAVSKAAGATAVVDTLIAAGADVGAQDDSEPSGPLFSPLHSAAQSGNYEAAHALLRHGADVRARHGPSGAHPVHFACRYLHEDVADLLLRWGADETIATRYDSDAAEYMLTVEEIQEDEEQGGGEEATLATLANMAKRERILTLLGRAPNDRAWRRRGFVVLCRAHPERLRLARGKGTSAGGGLVGSSSNKVARQKVFSGAGGGEDDGGATAGSLDRLAAWLMELPEANLFRHVVEFL